MFIYELLSEITPFMIFCWLLFKQVLYFTRAIKKEEGLAFIDKYGDQNGLLDENEDNSPTS